jgi:Spy/CpxP family protein refolding chaperone
MKISIAKPMFIAGLVAGNLFAWNLALRADDSTNTPPSNPPASDVKPHVRGFERMVEELNLTDDQKPKVKAIMDAQTQKMRDLRADDGLSQDDKRAKMKAIHEDTATQLKAVLTPDQFAKWQQMSQHMPRHPMQNGDNPPPANPPPSAPPQN